MCSVLLTTWPMAQAQRRKMYRLLFLCAHAHGLHSHFMLQPPTNERLPRNRQAIRRRRKYIFHFCLLPSLSLQLDHSTWFSLFKWTAGRRKENRIQTDDRAYSRGSKLLLSTEIILHICFTDTSDTDPRAEYHSSFIPIHIRLPTQYVLHVKPCHWLWVEMTNFLLPLNNILISPRDVRMYRNILCSANVISHMLCVQQGSERCTASPHQMNHEYAIALLIHAESSVDLNKSFWWNLFARLLATKCQHQPVIDNVNFNVSHFMP